MTQISSGRWRSKSYPTSFRASNFRTSIAYQSTLQLVAAPMRFHWTGSTVRGMDVEIISNAHMTFFFWSRVWHCYRGRRMNHVKCICVDVRQLDALQYVVLLQEIGPRLNYDTCEGMVPLLQGCKCRMRGWRNYFSMGRSAFAKTGEAIPDKPRLDCWWRPWPSAWLVVLFAHP